MIQRIRISILIRIYERILHKDAMKLKIEKYRLHGAKIGENVRAFSPILSSESYMISIGNNVTISTGVKFCTHDNSSIKFFENGTDFVGQIVVGDNSFIGMNVILGGGVQLPAQCIVGAGSVVTKSFFEEGCVIAGNPARVIGNVENLKRRYTDNVFNFRGMNAEQKKKEILRNPEKLIRK